MRFTSLPSALLLGLALHIGVEGAGLEDKKPKPVDPCTISSTTGSFFDLRPLSIQAPEEGKKPAKNAKTDSWHARGYDYKGNFTLNVCAPVVEEVKDFVGVDKNHWKNVSAFYEYDGKKYSVGQQSGNLTLRGRKLVVEYTNGSPCGGKNKKRSWDDDDDDDKSIRRKSSIISFHCEKDPLATASASYVGTDPEECAYFFEVRSQAACGGSEPAKQTVGPGAVFAIIGVIAILHRRFHKGELQKMSYEISTTTLSPCSVRSGWLVDIADDGGEGNVESQVAEVDVFIIATSSCSRCLPTHRGYNTLSISANGHSGDGSNGRGSGRDRGVSANESGRRNSGSEDENRLIDQLDEEWDD
ncbi:putative vacuolar sorting receptor protein [Botrytis fragariae]|uniref:Putative vacuolar sorting receptor protein n=1 Tax=Botrytis fragariae TaxID=1964551 RepID=A0A8H6AU32_9HELO|nr:putative vacuolar sorting receptor protein [Botrytis fragariae]KAF5873612.1 putative vacuolar sorting receptor protein [Botrytis fragariae]